MPPVPAPSNIRLMKGRGNGTDSGGRKVSKPPAFKRIPPEPPEYLGSYAKRVWRETVEELARLDLVKQPDAHAFAGYCEAVEAFARVVTSIHEDGVTYRQTVRTRDGEEYERIVVNPALAVQMKASAELRNWAVQFGLTPSSEQKVGNGEPDDVTDAAAF